VKFWQSNGSFKIAKYSGNNQDNEADDHFKTYNLELDDKVSNAIQTKVSNY
jgi:hypothetical protein